MKNFDLSTEKRIRNTSFFGSDPNGFPMAFPVAIFSKFQDSETDQNSGAASMSECFTGPVYPNF